MNSHRAFRLKLLLGSLVLRVSSHETPLNSNDHHSIVMVMNSITSTKLLLGPNKASRLENIWPVSRCSLCSAQCTARASHKAGHPTGFAGPYLRRSTG